MNLERDWGKVWRARISGSHWPIQERRLSPSGKAEMPCTRSCFNNNKLSGKLLGQHCHNRQNTAVTHSLIRYITSGVSNHNRCTIHLDNKAPSQLLLLLFLLLAHLVPAHHESHQFTLKSLRHLLGGGSGSPEHTFYIITSSIKWASLARTRWFQNRTRSSLTKDRTVWSADYMRFSSNSNTKCVFIEVVQMNSQVLHYHHWWFTSPMKWASGQNCMISKSKKIILTKDRTVWSADYMKFSSNQIERNYF